MTRNSTENLVPLRRRPEDDPKQLPEDFATLCSCQLKTGEKLAAFAAIVEPSWAEAERNAAEIARLLELQSAILAKVSARAAGDTREVLQKLRVWQSDARTGDDDRIEEAVIHSVIEDIERICARAAHAEAD